MRSMARDHLIERSGHNRLAINRKGLQKLIPDLMPVPG